MIYLLYPEDLEEELVFELSISVIPRRIDIYACDAWIV